MKSQKEISESKLKEKIGNNYTAIIDGMTEDGKYLIARSYMDIPDEDSVIYIRNNGKIHVGEFVKCKIVDVNGYDLVGEIKG